MRQLPNSHCSDETRWDIDFLRLAEFWAQRKSKDPSTQVAAIITDARKSIVGIGYNGFPRGVDDTPARLNDRPIKYKYVVHAEPNAILIAGDRARGGTIYTWPLFTCNECAKLVIQAGISRVVAPNMEEERWASAYDISLTMYHEAGVETTLYQLEEYE